MPLTDHKPKTQATKRHIGNSDCSVKNAATGKKMPYMHSEKPLIKQGIKGQMERYGGKAYRKHMANVKAGLPAKPMKSTIISMSQPEIDANWGKL